LNVQLRDFVLSGTIPTFIFTPDESTFGNFDYSLHSIQSVPSSKLRENKLWSFLFDSHGGFWSIKHGTGILEVFALEGAKQGTYKEEMGVIPDGFVFYTSGEGFGDGIVAKNLNTFLLAISALNSENEKLIQNNSHLTDIDKETWNIIKMKLDTIEPLFAKHIAEILNLN
jgi:hypothetical protein